MSNITENPSTACSWTSKLETQCIEAQSSISQSSSSATTLVPDPITIPEPAIIYELVKTVPSNSQENSVQLKNIDSLSNSNISIESDVSIDPNNATCIFCHQKTRKHLSKRLPLFSSNKEDFQSKVEHESENYIELINKIANYSHSKMYYHKICQLNFSHKVSANKKTTKSRWHDLRRRHQTAFELLMKYIFLLKKM